MMFDYCFNDEMYSRKVDLLGVTDFSSKML